MSVYAKTARKNTKGTTYAFGRVSALDGLPTEQGGYAIYRLHVNYAPHLRGGLAKTWRVSAENLAYPEAVKLMNKKLGREEFRVLIAQT